jgi:hypothetical protein
VTVYTSLSEPPGGGAANSHLAKIMSSLSINIAGADSVVKGAMILQNHWDPWPLPDGATTADLLRNGGGSRRHAMLECDSSDVSLLYPILLPMDNPKLVPSSAAGKSGKSQSTADLRAFADKGKGPKMSSSRPSSTSLAVTAPVGTIYEGNDEGGSWDSRDEEEKIMEYLEALAAAEEDEMTGKEASSRSSMSSVPSIHPKGLVAIPWESNDSFVKLSIHTDHPAKAFMDSHIGTASVLVRDLLTEDGGEIIKWVTIKPSLSLSQSKVSEIGRRERMRIISINDGHVKGRRAGTGRLQNKCVTVVHSFYLLSVDHRHRWSRWRV